MFIFYDLIFFVVAVIYLPRYLMRRKFHSGFFSRLGFLIPPLNLNNPIWVHAVSVGEAMSVKFLVEELRKIYPEKKFVLSTVTKTGNKIVQGIAREGDLVTFLPLDMGFIVKKIIDRIDPSLFIIAETEIWPNMISYLFKKNIPVVVVNGRISDRSFKGYLLIKPLLSGILDKVTLFCVQTETDLFRFNSLGVIKEKIKVAGNMKFDLKDYSTKKSGSVYRERLGLCVKEKIILAGSTHPKEEEIILRAYQKLSALMPDLRLIIAPRHPERTQEISSLIRQCGLETVKLSSLNNHSPQAKTNSVVFILDTVGELMDFYTLADIVFVGGSLVKIGGHNILEPASLGKAILFGPYMFNFSDIVELFLKSDAAIQVHSAEELKNSIQNLLERPYRVMELGEKAKAIILANRGATKNCLESIRSIYVSS